MFPPTFTIDEQVNWRTTLLKGPPWSRHLAMTVIFNLLNLLQLALTVKRHHGVPYLGVFLIVMVFLLSVLGWYAASLYKQTRERLKALPEDSAEAQALLHISYAGYRLYLMGLGTSFVAIAFFNLIH